VATELIELGEPMVVPDRTGIISNTKKPSSLSPVLALYQMVDMFEDPLAASGISRDDVEPEALQAIDRLYYLSKKARMELVRPSGLGAHEAALGELIAYRNSLAHTLGKKKGFLKKIGKNIKRIHKTIVRKVVNIAKSPTFLAIAGVVVNIIPGVGQIASVALMAAAASRKVYAAKIEQKKAKKKQGQMDAAGLAEFLREIIDYNDKTIAYYAGLHQPIPAGALMDGNGDPTNDLSKAPHTTAGAAPPPAVAPPSTQPPPPSSFTDPGIYVAPTYSNPIKPGPTALPPVPPPSSAIAQGAAFAVAGALAGGGGAGAANSLLDDLPPDIAKQAAAMVPGIQAQSNDPAFKAASLKAIGGFVATQELAAGLGIASMGTPQQMDLAKAIWQQGDATVQAAIRAGEQDLITAGAIDGSSATVEAALKKGRASWETSWTPYYIAGGGVVAAGVLGLVLFHS
jgi:hypothetical protein